MRIQHNVTAMNSHRMYTINTGNLAKNVEKLSSGYRINRAGDDAAGLAISEKMRAQIRGLSMASKNSQDAISLIQTAEGALQSMHDVLQRMRELSVQSASDTNETSIDRAALNAEFQQLIKEIDDTANKTVFNDQKVIDGTFSKNIISTSVAGTVVSSQWVGVKALGAGQMSATFQVNFSTLTVASYVADVKGSIAMAGTAIYLSADKVTTITLTTSTTPSGGDSSLNGIWILSYDQSTGLFNAKNQTNGKVMTAAAATAVGVQSGSNITIDFGHGIMLTAAGSPSITNLSQFNGLSGKFVISGSQTQQDEKLSNFVSIAGETVELVDGMTTVAFKYHDISFQLAKAWTATTDATSVLKAYDFTINVNRIENTDLVIQTGANQGDESKISIDKMDAKALGVNFASISGRLEASSAITQVNNALNIVSTQRAALGALQNRLEFKIQNLDTSTENLQAAEARIRDVDMAKEMTAFMKNNILLQSSVAMLAQANALPQSVLQLLG